MDILTLKRDDRKVAEGIWKEWEGAEFKIAAITSKGYTKAQKAAVRRLTRRQMNDAEHMLNVSIELAARHLLLDWKGVTKGGVEFPSNYENHLETLKMSPEFRDWVTSEATDIANFQAEGEREDVQALKSVSRLDAEVGGEVGGDPEG